MFCTKCGNQNDDDAKFCIYCGATFDEQPAEAAPQSSSPLQTSPIAAPTAQQPQVGQTFMPPAGQPVQQPVAQMPQQAGQVFQPSAEHSGSQTPTAEAPQQTGQTFQSSADDFGQQPFTQPAQQTNQAFQATPNQPAQQPAAQIPQQPSQLSPTGSYASASGGYASSANKKAMNSKKKGIIIAAAAVAAVIVIVLAVVFFGTNLFKPGNDAAGGAIASNVKSGVNEYSWEELSSISDEIGAADSSASALEIAKSYNLVGQDGKLTGNETKDLTLGDGTTMTVQIAGFYHDDLASGGKAGISFITKNCASQHAMNVADSNNGGWRDSSMRGWLNSDYYDSLPSDLKAVIVPVSKQTNNTGATTDMASVTSTSDKLWLLSSTEICGTIGWYSVDPNEKVFDDVLNIEGSEYQLFSDLGISNTKDNASIVKTYNNTAVSWFTRTPSPKHPSAFYVVSPTGLASSGQGASNANGAVFGFCI